MDSKVVNKMSINCKILEMDNSNNLPNTDKMIFHKIKDQNQIMLKLVSFTIQFSTFIILWNHGNQKL